MLSYLLTFCRIAIGLLFAYSFLAKARDVGQFAQTITDFELLPSRRSRPLALLFLTGELAVVALVLVGGRLLPVAFGLAILLLVTFTIALASVLARNILIPCHCFGAHEKPVSIYDVWRNAGFIGCSFLGWWLFSFGGGGQEVQTGGELVLIGFGATVFIAVWAQLGDLALLFANQKL